MSDFNLQELHFKEEDTVKPGLNLSALAVKESSVTFFFLIAVIISGIVAYLGMGRAEDPTFTVKVFTVTAAPRLVPDEFYQGRKKIQDEASRLPQGVLPPVLNAEYADVTFTIYSLDAPGLPPRLLTREAETLRQDILHVPGVKKVTIFGERPERIFVQFSYDRLATLGIKPREIFDALVHENAVTPSGSIDTKDQQVYIRLDGAFNDLEKIRDTPIISGSRAFKLSDIAGVERGYEDPATFLVRHNGQPAMMLNVVMRDGFNGLTLGKSLDEERKKLQSTLPTGITLSKVTDQSTIIKDAVGEFQLKFFVALLVVLIVCLLSLGWRVGIVVAAAVPVTLSATLMIMFATGRVLDRVTLGALILSLGLLVDDAIISIETMVVKMEEGWDRVRAAGYAWNHTAAPMLSGTLLTIIGLMPVAFAAFSAGRPSRYKVTSTTLSNHRRSAERY